MAEGGRIRDIFNNMQYSSLQSTVSQGSKTNNQLGSNGKPSFSKKPETMLQMKLLQKK